MKFHFSAAATLVMSVAAAYSMAATAAVTDGVYEGEAHGRNAPVKVSVTVKDGKIADVKVIDQKETKGISDAALKNIPKEIVESQSTKVDVVSGASLTSKAIIGATAASLAKAGATQKDFAKKVPHKSLAGSPAKEVDTDILVIGGGNAGITAAVRGVLQGKKVILIEKRAAVGGVSALNHGGFVALGTRYQREVMKETKDSPELLYKDMLRSGRNLNDPVVAHMVTQMTGKVGDWLIDDLKFPYGAAWVKFPDHSADRQISIKGNSVKYQQLMLDIYKKHGGVIMTDMRANKFMTKGHGVVGVKANGLYGQPYTFKAKSFVLASGGFGANRNNFKDKKAHVLFYGLPTETGDGLRMGREIGADTLNLELATTYPNGVEVQPGRSIDTTGSSSFAVKKNAIFVDATGKRVINENASLAALAQATLKAPGHLLYLVMDKQGYDTYVKKAIDDHTFTSPAVFESWKTLINNGRPANCEGTLEACAKTMGINPKGLLAQVAQWNSEVKAGKDTQFGRTNLHAIGEGPYHIIEQKARYQTTLGGLRANAQLQIVDKSGKPFKNLYGAGCVVGGANGAHPLPAMMNTWAIVSGYVAGDNAVKNASK